MKDFVQDLIDRGIVHSMTNGTAEHLKNSRIIYAGFDPTADSLTLGHMVPLMMLWRAKQAGHRSIALVGRATAMIGDPSGKNKERPVLKNDIIEKNTNSIDYQIRKIVGADTVTNYNYYRDINCLEFFQTIGKHFSVNSMFSKDSVKNRLDTGLSFTEFSYQIFQAHDFYKLYTSHSCTVQIGGSDQWGNICEGIAYIHKRDNVNTFGLTCNLITQTDGTKFGKTEKGTLWLSRNKTSPYEIYQYIINLDDDSAFRLLMSLSRLTIEEINSLDKEDKGKRHLQKALARDLIEMIHSKEDADLCASASDVIFGDKFSAKEIIDFNKKMPIIPKRIIEPITEPVSILYLLANSVCESNGAARRLIRSGGLSINKKIITNEEEIITKDDLINNEYLLVQTGKKNFHILQTQ